MDFNRGLLRRRRDELHRMNVRDPVPRAARLEGAALGARRRWQIAEELTRHNTGMTLTIAFNYGGRVEVVDAVKR